MDDTPVEIACGALHRLFAEAEAVKPAEPFEKPPSVAAIPQDTGGGPAPPETVLGRASFPGRARSGRTLKPAHVGSEHALAATGVATP